MMLKSNLEYFRTDEIRADTSAGDFRNKIKGYYKQEFGTDPLVDLECVLNNGTVASSCSDVNVTERIYTITVPKSIDTPSQIQVTPVANTTDADFEFIYPGAIQLSTPTLKGSFYLVCYDVSGNPWRTDDMGRGASTTDVYNKLVQACPWLRDSVTVWNGREYYHSVDGIDFIFYFSRVEGDLAQFEIHSSDVSPLNGTNVRIEQKVIDTYGPNVYYDVLPFEQLYTYDTAPPIKAVIDGMPVLCVSTHCSYSYEASTALITGLSVNLQEVTVTGIDLPLSADITSLRISNQECAITSSSALEIICTLPNQWVAG